MSTACTRCKGPRDRLDRRTCFDCRMANNAHKQAQRLRDNPAVVEHPCPICHYPGHKTPGCPERR